MHWVSGEQYKLEGRMTTRYVDNRLGCVIKYLKKIFDQYNDVIMTSSLGHLKKKKFLKPKLLKTHFTPRRRQDRRNLRPPIAKDNRLSFQKINQNLVLYLCNIA